MAHRRTRISGGLIVALVGALVAGCGGGGGSDDELALVAYSTPQVAYEDLIPAFQKTSDGKDVDFSESYGSSGSQSRAVEAGLNADLVAMSLEPDITRLVDAKLVSPDWNKDEYHGMVTDSVVVFVVRPGNPKHIESWEDLIKPGVKVVTPNPFSSGSAQWNIMAAYGAAAGESVDEDAGVDYLKKLFDNVVAQDKSARDALQTFTGGTGDVLISYENEAITAQQNGEKVDYVMPDSTLLIENPIAVTTDAPEAAQKFVDFLRTDEAQKIFASKGYRPVVAKDLDAKQFPTPAHLMNIEDFGGWPEVTSKFFDPQNGLMVDIEHDIGVSTGG